MRLKSFETLVRYAGSQLAFSARRSVFWVDAAARLIRGLSFGESPLHFTRRQAVLLCYVLLAHRGLCAQTPSASCSVPIDEDRLKILLSGKVTEERILKLIESCGTSLKLTPSIRERLTHAGASEKIAEALFLASLGKNTEKTQVGESKPASSAVVKQIEITFWNSIKNEEDPSIIRSYLEKYPDGEFVTLARAKLAQLETSRKPQASAGSGTRAEVVPKSERRTYSFTARHVHRATGIRKLAADNLLNCSGTLEIDEAGIRYRGDKDTFEISRWLISTVVVGFITNSHWIRAEYLQGIVFREGEADEQYLAVESSKEVTDALAKIWDGGPNIKQR